MKDLVQAFIAKFYETVIVVIAVFLLLSLVGLSIQSWRVSALKDNYALLESKYQTDVAKADALIEKAKAEAIAIEKKWSEKLLNAEITHNAKLQEIITDSNSAKSAVERMSTQINTATDRMSAATREAIIEYASANGDVLEKCVSEYRTVAQRADEHAADAKRLSDAWPN